MSAVNAADADATAAEPPLKPRHLRRPHWPPLNRGLLIAAAVFFATAAVTAVLVQIGALHGFDRRLLLGLQARASGAQDVGLAIFAYLGSVELTMLIALVLILPLFKGLRLLSGLPALVVLLASGVEALGKTLIRQPVPDAAYQRFPGFLPTLGQFKAGSYSFPSGHVLRATIVFGLILYLADRWQLFGRDAQRLSPILVLVPLLMAYTVLYLGWHWFSDAAGGLLLGIALLLPLIALLERNRLVVPAGPAGTGTGDR